MLKLTRRRCCWSLLLLLAAVAVIGVAGLLLYEPEERIGPANFHRLRPGTTRDETRAMLGEPDRHDRHVFEPDAKVVLDWDWTLERWGAEGTRYSAGIPSINGIYEESQFSSWSGAVYLIDVEWGNDGRVVGAALTRRGSAPRSLWERTREWLAVNIGL